MNENRQTVMVITYWHNTIIPPSEIDMRQDVGQDDGGLNILNKRQRVGIIYIYYYYYYQVSKLYTEMELYFLDAMACFKINDNKKRCLNLLL